MANHRLYPGGARRINLGENAGLSASEADLLILRSKVGCDVTFFFRSNKDSDPVEIKAHQLFLRRRSPVFNYELETCTVGLMKEIEIADVSPATFQIFIEYIYGDQLEANMVEAIDVRHLAEKYQVTSLIGECDEILRKDILIQDSLQVYEAAGRRGLSDLKEKAGKILASYLDTLSDHPSFSMAQETTLVELLGRDDLIIDEIKLFLLVVKWGSCHVNDDINDQRLKPAVAGMIRLVRFPIMTAEQFATIVVPKNLLPLDDVAAILTYLSIPEGKRNHAKLSLRFSTVPRFQEGKFLSFSGNMPRQEAYRFKSDMLDRSYGETFSFSARVYDNFTSSTARKPVMTKVHLCLPQWGKDREEAMEFTLCVMQFNDKNLQAQAMTCKRQMVVQSQPGKERVEVKVVPPLKILDGNHYGIVVKDETCHEASDATLIWSEQFDLPINTIRLEGHTTSIELHSFRNPQVVANFSLQDLREPVRRMKTIAGVTVVLP